jgi:hypothetical protein
MTHSIAFREKLGCRMNSVCADPTCNRTGDIGWDVRLPDIQRSRKCHSWSRGEREREKEREKERGREALATWWLK